MKLSLFFAPSTVSKLSTPTNLGCYTVVRVLVAKIMHSAYSLAPDKKASDIQIGEPSLAGGESYRGEMVILLEEVQNKGRIS